MPIRNFLALAVLIAATHTSSAEPSRAIRKWTHISGRSSVEARFVEIEEGIAVLERSNGNSLRVPLTSLSPSDRQYIESQTDLTVHNAPFTPGAAVTNSIGMKLTLLPAGEFAMGTTGNIRGAQPQHKVRITKPFYMGVTEVTQTQYERVMGYNPSAFSWTGKQSDLVAGEDTSDYPVETVSWEKAVEFCKRLSALPAEKSARRVYRLPTEAEWEYACRAGTTTSFSFGDSEAKIGKYGWCRDTRTHPVGQKLANAWGLYDVHGNVSELCSDICSHEYYKTSPTDDPTGPTEGSRRALRGGDWRDYPSHARSAQRGMGSGGCDNIGFRIVLYTEAPDDPEAMTEILHLTLKGHRDDVRSVTFSPDGKTLASGDDDNLIKLWDPQMGVEKRTLKGHRWDVNSVAFSPDGQTLASGSYDDTIKLWDPQTTNELGTLKGHQENVNAIAFSPDGRMLASGSDDKTIKLWDPLTGSELRTLEGHQGDVSSVAFSPNGKILASGSDDHTIKLWDPLTGSEIRTLKRHDAYVNSVAFSPDGKTLASCDDDNLIKLWDSQTGMEKRTLSGHRADVNSVAFSPDGQTLASGSDDDTIKLWDLRTGIEIRTLDNHRKDVNSVAFSPNGKTLASCSYDRTINLFNVAE
jgi:formylglycine-generating enzyme required for sulfatase activity/Tol biopolymer transport system component